MSTDRDKYQQEIPTKQELKELERLAADWQKYWLTIAHLERIWHFADAGYFSITKSTHNRKTGESKIRGLRLSTGGWSGNEDIIVLLQKTMFWALFWQSSERGGHYHFSFKDIKRKSQ